MNAKLNVIGFLKNMRVMRGVFRLSFLVSLGFALWGAFVTAPKHIADFDSIPVSFTSEERDEFREELKSKYKFITEEEIEEWCDNIFKYYYGGGWWLNDGMAFRVQAATYGERAGKVSSFSRSSIVNKAVNRIIDEHSWINFSGGKVVQNKAYNLKPFLCSEDDFSVIPGFAHRFWTAARFGAIFGVVSWLGVVFILPVFLALVIWGVEFFYRNLRWIQRGFTEK